MTSSNPQIDLLLATFNGSRYLPALLDSIVGQTCADWRLICRDDASGDSTGRILHEFAREFPERVVLIEDAGGRIGVRANFSSLLQASNAPYFLPCDQDDVWRPDKIRRMVDALIGLERMEGRQCPMLVHSDLEVVDRNLDLICKSFWAYQYIDPSRSRWNELVVQNVVTGCAMIGNASLRSAALPVPEAAIMHDWWLALVASVLGRIDYIPEQTTLYRQHGQNDTGAKKWGMGYILNSAYEALRSRRLHESFFRYQLQAEALLDVSRDRILYSDRIGLEAFSGIMENSALGRRLTLWKHRIRKSGFLRNLAMFSRI